MRASPPMLAGACSGSLERATLRTVPPMLVTATATPIRASTTTTPRTIQSTGLPRRGGACPIVPHCACPPALWAPQAGCCPHPGDASAGCCQPPPGGGGGCCAPPGSQAPPEACPAPGCQAPSAGCCSAASQPPCGCWLVGAGSQEPADGCAGLGASQEAPWGCGWVGAWSQEPADGCAGTVSPRRQPSAEGCSPPDCGGTGPASGWVASSSSDRPHHEQVLASCALVVPQCGQVRCPMGLPFRAGPTVAGVMCGPCDRYQVGPRAAPRANCAKQSARSWHNAVSQR